MQEGVRRLVDKGALRLVERTRAGHVVEVRLPEEIRGVCANGAEAQQPGAVERARDFEEIDFPAEDFLRSLYRQRRRSGGPCQRPRNNENQFQKGDISNEV